MQLTSAPTGVFPSHDTRWLWAVRKSRLVVAVCDNDAAGSKLAKYGHTAHFMTDSKDLGEASDTYVTDFLKEYECQK